MTASNHSPTLRTAQPPTTESRFAANDVRLSPRTWLFLSALILLAFWLIPLGWQTIEPLHLETDYRVPFSLGNDYWNYRRASREVCRGDATVLVGDSVLWGHYVTSHETLSHCLNEASGAHPFVNLAIDGIHPVAMAGLLTYYGDAIRDQRVLVNCNLLWMSSKRHDLSSDEEMHFNHPALVPQFTEHIPCYRATLSERLGIVIGRHFRFLGWADHLRIAYYDSDNLATWTLEHPYQNPLRPLTLDLPTPDEPPTPEPDVRPWNDKGLRPINPQWVPLEKSLQWRSFQHTIEQLRQRGNRVFVMIGPLNEHMLSQQALAAYHDLKRAAAAWHAQQRIPYVVPDALPSETYADLSHPTAAGYVLLATQLMDDGSFRRFLSE